jgi:hypothetical protein
MDALVFGQEFSRKLCNLPAPWFIDNMLLPLARKISPALRVGSLDQPFFYRCAAPFLQVLLMLSCMLLLMLAPLASIMSNDSIRNTTCQQLPVVMKWLGMQMHRHLAL